MNKKTFLLILFAVLLFGCHKEPKPTFVGKWSTVTTVGFKFDYDILAGGYHCRKLPEVFGETSFCYPYDVVDETTIVIKAPVVERWTFEFLGCGEVADVFVTLEDSTKQEFILKRVE